MATYVLVHGGGHGGWCYQKLARILRPAGHEVYTPTLTGLGERSHLLSADVDLNMHIRDITALLHYENLCDVILVGHSYGGMVITGVADRASDRIGCLVYLDAATPVNKQSLMDAARPVMEPTLPSVREVNGIRLALFPSPDAGRMYGVDDPEDLAWMAERLTPQPWNCFDQPLELTNEDALWALPQYHIVRTAGLARPEVRDPARMAELRAEGRLWDIDSGHDLMITEPDALARILEEIARA